MSVSHDATAALCCWRMLKCVFTVRLSFQGAFRSSDVLMF